MSIEKSIFGVILRKQDTGESDRLVTLYTKELGKINVVARGARKSGSRLAASVEPFTLAQLQIGFGKHRIFLKQSQILDSFRGLRLDYEKLTAATALSELYLTFMQFDQVCEDTFDLLQSSQKAIEEHDLPTIALVWASLKLMQLEGILPNWINCNVNQTELTESPAWASPMAGGYTSMATAEHYDDRFAVSAEVLIGLDKTVQLDRPPKHLKHARECLLTLFRFWRHHAHSNLPAMQSYIQNDLKTTTSTLVIKN